MKLLLVLLAVSAVLIKSSNCVSTKKCKNSDFTPCEDLDMKKLLGRWNYVVYVEGNIAVNTCSFSEIRYTPCKDKYSITYHTFKGDVETVEEAWIDIPTSGIGIWDINVLSVQQRVFVTEVDYDKYVLIQGCYQNKRYAYLLVRANKLTKKLRKQLNQIIKENKLNKDVLVGLDCNKVLG